MLDLLLQGCFSNTHIGSCENNSTVTVVVESQHIVVMGSPTLMESKDKPLYISIAMTSHEKHSKIHSSIAQECVNEIKD